jgi:DNA-binding transcriptional MerR regulator
LGKLILNNWLEYGNLHTIMIGRQLDLFGGPPKPPKNIVIEDEPSVPEPVIAAPEPLASELISPEDEPGNKSDSLSGEAGVHVQMPSSEPSGHFFLPVEIETLPEQDNESFKLKESGDDYTLEEAIAAAPVLEGLPGSEENISPMELDGTEDVEEEITPSDRIPELPDSEFEPGENIADDFKQEEEGDAAPGTPSVLPGNQPDAEAVSELSLPSLEDEPDWVTGDLPDSEPELTNREDIEEATVDPAPGDNSEALAALNEEQQDLPGADVQVAANEEDATGGTEAGPLNIPPDQALYSRQYYTMRETANMFNVNQSLLRFWENEFDILKPKKNRKGDRYFRPDDIKNLELIYHLLRVRKFTISGAKDYLKNKAKSLDTFVMVQRLEKLKLFLQELKSHA